MKTIKLKAQIKDYMWGGTKLFSYGKTTDKPIIGESWELSCYPGMESIIDSGEDKGKLLSEVVTIKELGKNSKKTKTLPILSKLIDANDNLSLQVHPSDKYALEHENSLGKTEMWYVVEASEDAMLHIGFSKDVSREEVEERIKNNTIMEVVNHIHVKPGDCYFIPSGTIHAIGKGCLIFEVQENSNITYRVYDYDRRDKNGNPRELHVNKALDVLDYEKTTPENHGGYDYFSFVCDYFGLDHNVYEFKNYIKATRKSFACFTILNGEGVVDGIPFKKGDTFFVPANKKATIEGEAEVVTVYSHVFKK